MYLDDTDWIIDFLLGKQGAIESLEIALPTGLATSIITYAEVYQGIYFGRTPTQSEQSFLALLAHIDLLLITESIARRAARIRGRLKQQGLAIPMTDILIAATAIEHDLELMSRNLRHFQRIPELSIATYPLS
jgi:predicted nucleic acid-binding protein